LLSLFFGEVVVSRTSTLRGLVLGILFLSLDGTTRLGTFFFVAGKEKKERSEKRRNEDIEI
jgi:hypothetical protein